MMIRFWLLRRGYCGATLALLPCLLAVSVSSNASPGDTATIITCSCTCINSRKCALKDAGLKPKLIRIGIDTSCILQPIRVNIFCGFGRRGSGVQATWQYQIPVPDENKARQVNRIIRRLHYIKSTSIIAGKM